MSTAAPTYFCQHHTPSGQSVGTGSVALNVVRVTGAAVASPWTKCYCAPLFSHTHYWYTVSMFKLSGVYQNISTAVLLYYVEPFFPPGLWSVHVYVKSSVYTVQYHHMLYSKHSYYCCTVDPFSPPDFCLYTCKDLEFRVRSEAFVVA